MTVPKRIFGFSGITASNEYKDYRNKLIEAIEAAGYKQWQRTSYWVNAPKKVGIFLPGSSDIEVVTFNFTLINPIDGPHRIDSKQYEFKDGGQIDQILSDLTAREANEVEDTDAGAV